MADFSQLKVERVEVQKFTFWNIVGEPVLHVKHAGESNKDYFNEQLRHAEHLQKRRAKLNVEIVKDNRNRDRDLYPQYVVVGWEKVLDKDGNEVPFNAPDCKNFLKALPDEEFDNLRDFCREPYNFRKVNESAAAAGNSQTA